MGSRSAASKLVNRPGGCGRPQPSGGPACCGGAQLPAPAWPSRLACWAPSSPSPGGAWRSCTVRPPLQGCAGATPLPRRLLLAGRLPGCCVCSCASRCWTLLLGFGQHVSKECLCRCHGLIYCHRCWLPCSCCGGRRSANLLLYPPLLLRLLQMKTQGCLLDGGLVPELCQQLRQVLHLLGLFPLPVLRPPAERRRLAPRSGSSLRSSNKPRIAEHLKAQHI